MNERSNPLLDYGRLPAFDQIEPQHVVSGVRQILADLNSGLDKLESDLEPTWDGLVVRLRDLVEPLDFAWFVVSHLMSVKNSPELREAHEEVQPEVVAAGLRINQSEPIFKGLMSLKEAREFELLDPGKKRVVDQKILRAQLAGVGLDGDDKTSFNAIVAELAKLSTTYSNNVLDSTKEYALVLSNQSEVDGLPAGLKSVLAQRAEAAGDCETADPVNGPWRLGADQAVIYPFLQHATRRDIREESYRAWISRASNDDKDNVPNAGQILKLRKQMADLLGYNNFAEVSLASKMASSVDEVDALMEELSKAALQRAHGELAELSALCSSSGEDKMQNWDVYYWAERQREAEIGFTDEQSRPYFAFPRVLEGIFGLAKKLFGITFEVADGKASIWDPSVRFFNAFDYSGAHIASLYIDPYSRPENKRGGAWMNMVLPRKVREDGSIQIPVAVLVCNQTPPADGNPSLMSFTEVNTLFHEFGHGLQHMLTTVDYPEAAGLNNIEWDAIEIPSNFMQSWCYDQASLGEIAVHFETGERLSSERIEKLRKTRTLRSGMLMSTQILYSRFDMSLHSDFDPNGKESINEVKMRVAAKNVLMQPIPEDRFECSFTHIFAGGYAAGYYSYLWAAVMAADAYAAFEEAKSDAEIAETGKRFKQTVLGLGGSVHPVEVFEMFRGRKPNTDALKKQLGLVDE